LLRALSRLHAAGILHRDIKPSNIGFADDGASKLLDLGLAAVFRATSVSSAEVASSQQHTPIVSASMANPPGLSTATGALVGTLPYLSPEAVRGAPPDPSFDLWALSIVLYESLAGRNPFTGGTPYQVLLRIADVELPPLRDLAHDAPPAVALFLNEALNPDIRRRPPTADRLYEELRLVRQNTRATARVH
jgi:serine/threonine protein kinase